MTLQRIGWRENGDGLDVGLVVDRLLARGARAWWLADGDYLVDRGVGATGIVARAADAAASPTDVREIVRPAVALFTGPATGYPYWGYYALCLLRLGLDYVPVDGRDIAAGALAEANLFVIPGGFATWNFDRAEEAPGADAAVRDFLDRGGRAIGSCGGAYYLSRGRPGWTGTADAFPLYTHEYLQSGVGVLALDIESPTLGRGLPPSLDMPYYHGPIWDRVGSNSAVAARFADLVLAGRLGIENPLDHARFARDMKGKPAILDSRGARGEAILFSPHPEMGDLLRKYIALDGYARRYLPIRGLPVLRDTMRFYAPADSPSFRLVLNAAHDLLSRPGTRAVPRARPALARGVPAAALAALGRVLAGVAPGDDPDIAPVVETIVADLAARHAALDRDAAMPAILGERIAAAILAREQALAAAPIAQRLLEVELGIALFAALARLAAVDAALETT